MILNKKRTNEEKTPTASQSSTLSLNITQTNNPITTSTAICVPSCLINVNSKWKEEATTIAGGHGKGSELNQFNGAVSIDIDDEDQCFYISEIWNNRIVKWTFNGSRGEIVAGGNGNGSALNQLNEPRDAIVEKTSDSLIICDSRNKRVIQWFLRKNRKQEILISKFFCSGLFRDINGDLYVSDWTNERVIRWREGQPMVDIVAGGNRYGNNINQLNYPRDIFVDQSLSVYIADYNNNRIMKWDKDAKDGILLVDSSNSNGLDGELPLIPSVFVDYMGNIYFSESNRCKIFRWSPGMLKSTVIAGGYGCGDMQNQLNSPADFAFDRQGNLYVVDIGMYRIQKFHLDRY